MPSLDTPSGLNRHISRWGLAALAVVVALGLTACGGGGSSSQKAESGWSYTDDMGDGITLDAPPKRIVANINLAVALADMGLADLVVGVYWPEESPVQPASPNLDLTQFENLAGPEFGSIKVEEVLNLKPDLVLETTWDGEAGSGRYWYIEEDLAEKIKDVAPIARYNYGKDTTGPELIENAERLASALGAQEADLVQGRDAFTEASERVSNIAAEAGNPQLMYATVTPDGLSVAPPTTAGVNYLADDLGLDFLVPTGPDVTDGYQLVSWENADAYPDVDVVVLNTWDLDADVATLSKNQLWAKVPAAQNNAYMTILVDAPSALGWARYLDKFAGDLKRVTT